MDLIDRAEVLYKFVEILPDPYSLDWYKQAKPDEVKNLIDELYSIVLNVNRIDAQPVKRGHWIYPVHDFFYQCSECGAELIDDHFEQIGIFDDGYLPFCPNCGAKMDGGSDKTT